MSEALFPYYERELTFIRQLSQEFAKQYPASAGRLLLEPNRSVDPHVERLIESFALLAARIHHKLDDEFPELTDALLNILYPHFLAPIPSMAVVCVRGPLRKLAGGRAEHELEGQTVVELLRALEVCHPDTSGWILDERGVIRRHINVFVNGERGGEETPVAAADCVDVLPAISGGG